MCIIPIVDYTCELQTALSLLFIFQLGYLPVHVHVHVGVLKNNLAITELSMQRAKS